MSPKSKLWETFLDDVTKGDKDLQHFLQKAVGYSLTGSTAEEVLFFVYGPTATGKSTFLEAVKAALGDHAATVDVDAFLSKRFSSGGPSPELAKLRWKRMVVSVEVDEGRHLAEGLIKLVTGGDEISVRGLYQSPETFKPTFKIWIAANNRPKISDVDDALWRRILVIPFENQVPPDKRDRTLKARLCSTEVPGILSWAIRGRSLWHKEGLGKPPRAMEKAISEYREDVDPLKVWFEDITRDSKPDHTTAETDLYQSYAAWAKRTGVRYPLTQFAFLQRLTARGYVADRTNGIKVRKGILLVDDKKREF